MTFLIIFRKKEESINNIFPFTQLFWNQRLKTFKNCKNAIRPKVRFTSEIISELIRTTESLKGVKRFVVMSFDEIKI